MKNPQNRNDECNCGSRKKYKKCCGKPYYENSDKTKSDSEPEMNYKENIPVSELMKSLKKFIQIQSFEFGEGKIGIRTSDSLQGKWSEPFIFYTPEYPGVKKPFMYAAKAHPELFGNGIYITYNVNSFYFGELMENQTIYFPKFILMKIEIKDEH